MSAGIRENMLIGRDKIGAAVEARTPIAREADAWCRAHPAREDAGPLYSTERPQAIRLRHES